MSLEPSRRVLDFLRAEHGIRARELRPDRERLARALEAQGLEPHEAICAFEDRFGGWEGSWTVLGVMAMAKRSSARLGGHALIGQRGLDDFFMAPDGAVVTVEDGEPVTVAGSAEAWLEQLALRRAVELRPNAMYLRLRGASVAELARELRAQRDPAASDRVGCWALPKGQGLLIGPYGSEAATLTLVPSIRAATRILSLKVSAVSVEPLRPRDELLLPEEAPTRAEVLARASFEPLRRGAFEHAVELSHHGQEPLIEQWSLTTDDRARAHWHLLDGALRLCFFLGVSPSSKLRRGRPALSGIELAFDPRLRCDSDEELKAMLFTRGFTAFPAALAFDERFGGLSFWTDQPAILGVASALRRTPTLMPSEIGRGAPIALAEGRWWRLGPTGVVETAEEDDGSPQRSFPSADAFIDYLAQRAQPWKRFAYRVEV